VPLGALGRRDGPHVRDRVLEREDLEAAQAADQDVEELDGRAGVVQGPVGRPGGGAEVRRQGAEPVVGHLVLVEQPPRQRGRVQHARRRPPVPVAGAGRLEEARVVRGVVRDQHRAAEELQQRRQGTLERRGRRHHRLGDPGQDRDERRDRRAGVDQRGELPEALAAAHLDRADLGDAGVLGRPTVRLQVQHHERDLAQRRARLGQARLRVRLGHAQHSRTPVRHPEGSPIVK
jgi:hypothetical protein